MGTLRMAGTSTLSTTAPVLPTSATLPTFTPTSSLLPIPLGSSAARYPSTRPRPTLTSHSHRLVSQKLPAARVLVHGPGRRKVVHVAADGEGVSGQSSGFTATPAVPTMASPAGGGVQQGPFRFVAAAAGPGAAPTMIRSDARHEKLMKMQRELLQQLEERKKLHAALLQSLEDPASAIQAFNTSTKGGLPRFTGPQPPTSSLPTAPPPSSSPGLTSAAGRAAPAAPQPLLSPSARPPAAWAPSEGPQKQLPARPPASPVPARPSSAVPPGAVTPAPLPTPRVAGLAATVMPSPRPLPSVKPATSPISVPIPSAPTRQRAPTVAPPTALPAAAPTAPPAAAPFARATASPTAPPTAAPVSRATAPPAGPTTAPPKSAAAAPAPPTAAAAARTTGPPPAPPQPVVRAPASPLTNPPPSLKTQPPARFPPSPQAAPAAPRAAAVAAPAVLPPAVPKTAPPLAPPRMEKVAPRKVEPQCSSGAAERPEVAGEKPPAAETAPPLAGPNVMNIVLVASECAPWSKTGGLGDVVGALPKALARRGHRVMVVAPRYSSYAEAFDTSVRKQYNVAGQDMEVGYFHHYRDNVDWVFVDHGCFHHLDKNIYGGSREEVTKRMILLCKAAVEAPWHVPCGGVCYGDGNLVFVANDWHTALLPVYLQAYYRDHGMMQFARSVLVIHNMAHQGRAPVAEYGWLGLPDHFLNRFKLYDPIGGEHMNVFMAGIISAQRLVAVSHGYAWEIQTQMGGWGLDAVLRDHSSKLRGVVNGIDEQEWSPEVDQFLTEDGYRQFSTETLEDKMKCKAALQRELGLPERPDVPLLGFIGRLDYQKGVDIIGDAMPWITSQDCQLVMLGTGRQDLEDMLRSFEGRHRDKVRGWVGFSVKMAHRITAGVDILLMPSRFEPCGLNQLYAMRYGTVPVVHSVGGLRDTVQAFDPFNDTGLGWTFEKAEAGGLIHALGNAMYTYRDFKESWRKLMLRGMNQDLSWDNAAKLYEEILVEAKYTW